MPELELLRRVVDVLTRAGVDYMVTGSIVSSLQGDPRSTHDIDVVVALSPRDAPAILAAFPSPEFYLDEAAVLKAIAGRDMVNLLRPDTGEKVDFWMLTDDEFDQARFRRKIAEDVGGFLMNVSRPEDTILMKLRWAERSGGSEKQFRDALSVYEVQFPQLDQSLLDIWAPRLGVTTLLDRIRKEAKPV